MKVSERKKKKGGEKGGWCATGEWEAHCIPGHRGGAKQRKAPAYLKIDQKSKFFLLRRNDGLVNHLNKNNNKNFRGSVIPQHQKKI